MASLLLSNLKNSIRICKFNNPQRIAINQVKIYEQLRFAGHAKWQNIAGTKQANDLSKCRLISRYVMMVRRAVTSNGMQGDPKLNSRLNAVLTEASKFNVPKATLERAIARALDVKIRHLNLEIQGPGRSSIIVRCETDNVSNLRREIKKILKKHDANLLADDTIVNMFTSNGFIRTATKTSDDRDVTIDYAEDAAIMAGAEEVFLETYDDATEEDLKSAWVFKTDAQTLNPCKGELQKFGLKVLSAELDLVPYQPITFSEDIYDSIQDLTQALREHEQVVEVYHNAAEPKAAD